VLAGTAQDERGRPRLALDDEPRAMAMLATASGQPVETYVLAKMRRAAELRTEGDKALAHIHLAFARLPACEEEQALRLFVADELIEAGVTPRTLMKAQGFDRAPLDLLKAHFNPDQPALAGGQWARQRRRREWAGNRRIDKRRRQYHPGSFLPRAWKGSRTPLDRPFPRIAPRTAQRACSGAGNFNPKPSDFVGQDFDKLGGAWTSPNSTLANFQNTLLNG
jgi:hypothetical protein